MWCQKDRCIYDNGAPTDFFILHPRLVYTLSFNIGTRYPHCRRDYICIFISVSPFLSQSHILCLSLSLIYFIFLLSVCNCVPVHFIMHAGHLLFIFTYIANACKICVDIFLARDAPPLHLQAKWWSSKCRWYVLPNGRSRF